MQKKTISSLLLAVTMMTSQSILAEDGKITFAGNIVAQTCTINGNSSGTKDFTVALPTVSVKALSKVDETAGRTPFNIVLTGCTPSSGKVHTYFEVGPTVNTATGNLILNQGGARNVEIGLLNENLSEIKLGLADGLQNSEEVNIGSSGGATLSYFAQYVATGVASPGAANSSVMYSLIYP